MQDTTHIIRQSFLDIELSRTDHTNDLAQDIIDYCKEVCLEGIDEQLKNFKSGHYEIDTLEIDLGSFNSTTWKNSFKKRFDSELKHQLELTPFIEVKEKRRKSVDQIDGLTTEHLGSGKIGKNLLNPEESRSGALRTLKAFCFYLENGYLPWWSPQDDIENIFPNFKSLQKREYIDRVLPLIIKNGEVLERFVREMPAEKLEQFIIMIGVNKKLVEDKKTIWSRLTNALPIKSDVKYEETIFIQALIVHNNELKESFQQIFWSFLEKLIQHPKFRFVPNSKDKNDRISLLTKEFEKLWPELKHPTVANKKKQFMRQLTWSKKKKIKEKANNQINQIKDETNDHEFSDAVGYDVKNGDDDLIAKKQANEKPPSSNLKTLKVEKEGVYVNYAGIALFHPYLPSLFERLQLTENGLWKTEELKKKGVRILAYIATGNENCHENKCLLFKHLCGLSWDEYVNPRFILTLQEMEECHNLMTAVIGHWKVLKNTSLDGLREAFIERDGKLIHEETHWKLIVEQKAQDILIQQLPWGIGTIKLSWMEQMIWVHWI